MHQPPTHPHHHPHTDQPSTRRNTPNQPPTRARIQIKKSEAELNLAFGEKAPPPVLPRQPQKQRAQLTGPKPPPPGGFPGAAPPPSAAPAAGGGGDDPEAAADDDDDDESEAAASARPMTTLMLFGDAKAIEIAMRMIDEAVQQREAKAKQRAKEYERKKEAKRRERQMYHLRHARDYEELGLPMGASKMDVKKAYRCVVGCFCGLVGGWWLVGSCLD